MYYKIREVAERYGVAPHTIWQWVNDDFSPGHTCLVQAQPVGRKMIFKHLTLSLGLGQPSGLQVDHKWTYAGRVINRGVFGHPGKSTGGAFGGH